MRFLRLKTSKQNRISTRMKISTQKERNEEMKQDLSNTSQSLDSTRLNQDKWDLLLDLLEHPENYTKSQKDALLSDAEIKEMYQQMVETCEALDYQKPKEEMSMPSVSDEWERLKREKSEERRVKSEEFDCYTNDYTASSKQNAHGNPLTKFVSLWTPMRKVAAIAAVLIVSGITFAAIHLATRSHQKDAGNPTTAVVEQKDSVLQASASTKASSVAKADSLSQQKLPLVYEDAELQAILTPIAQHFQLKVVYQTEASRHIRLYLQLTEGMSLDDIIELMNHFEKVNIRHEGEALIVE